MQWYGSECVYQHEGRTLTPNHQTNELEKKVEVLKTLVIKMAKKMVNPKTKFKIKVKPQNRKSQL